MNRECGLSRKLLCDHENFEPEGDKLCPGNIIIIRENDIDINPAIKSISHQNSHETQCTYDMGVARHLNRRHLMITSTLRDIRCVPARYYHPPTRQ